jgi:carbon storage regulator
MLVLTRRIGELVLIGDEIQLTVIDVKKDRVRIGITAPKSIPIN